MRTHKNQRPGAKGHLLGKGATLGHRVFAPARGTGAGGNRTVSGQSYSIANAAYLAGAGTTTGATASGIGKRQP
ncbi:hypothetical protein M2281_005829 [Mesorhizobium soli]|nr:hypothetical protein [Mesorhizobium soli]